jgi:hypothetical protein
VIRLALITCSVLVILLITIFGFVPYAVAARADARATHVRQSSWIDNEASAELLNEKEDDSVRFAVLGDVQMGSALLPKVLRAIESEPGLDFIVQTGDLFARPRPGHYMLGLSQLATLEEELPFFIIPGNHDIRESSKTSMVQPHFEDTFGPAEFAFEYGSAYFLFCDNSMGPFRKTQYERIEAMLAENTTPETPTCLFLHAEPIGWAGSGKRNPEKAYRPLFGLLDTYGVDFVFSGNWHGYHIDKRGGTTFVINGHGSDFDNEDKLAPAHYTLVEIANGHITTLDKTVKSTLGHLAGSYLNDFFIARLGYSVYQIAWAPIFLAIGLLAAMAVLVAAIFIRPTTRESAPETTTTQPSTHSD